MAFKQYFNGLIWTDHAIERLKQRGLRQALASQAFYHPDKILRGSANGSTEYQKRYKKSLITIIAKQNGQGEWLVLSCWSNPPLPGTEDAKRQKNYRRYQRASFWGKVLWFILKQLRIMKY